MNRFQTQISLSRHSGYAFVKHPWYEIKMTGLCYQLPLHSVHALVPDGAYSTSSVMFCNHVLATHLVIMSFTVCETFLLVVTSSKERFLALGTDKVLSEKQKTSLMQQNNSSYLQVHIYKVPLQPAKTGPCLNKIICTAGDTEAKKGYC